MRLPLRTPGKLMLANFREKIRGSLRLRHRKPQINVFWREQSTLGILSN